MKEYCWNSSFSAAQTFCVSNRFFMQSRTCTKNQWKGLLVHTLNSKSFTLEPTTPEIFRSKKLSGMIWNVSKLSQNEQIYMFFVIFVHKMTSNGSFFFKWVKTGPVRFYHWYLKLEYRNVTKNYLPHMYMIWKRTFWDSNYWLVNGLSYNARKFLNTT